MAGNKPNREHKDTFFQVVFGNHRENALALYNAINGTDYDDPNDVIIVTIKDALYINVRNDVGILFDNTMNLYEHQSSVNPNMPLRGMSYFSEMYAKYLQREYGSRAVLYGRKLITIPAPRYYVFYNGTEDVPEKMDLRLSDAYEGAGDIEITAHLININYGQNSELMDACKPLLGYATFVHYIREYKDAGYEQADAIKMATSRCIREGILVDILRKERGRMNWMLEGMDVEEFNQYLREEGYNEGLAQGIEQGVEQGIEQAILSLKAKGYDEADISTMLDITLEHVKNTLSKA